MPSVHAIPVWFLHGARALEISNHNKNVEKLQILLTAKQAYHTGQQLQGIWLKLTAFILVFPDPSF